MKLIIVLTYILLVFMFYHLISLSKEIDKMKKVMLEYGINPESSKEDGDVIELDDDTLGKIELKFPTKNYELDEEIPYASEKLKEIEKNEYVYIHDMEKVLNEAISLINLKMKYPPELDRVTKRYYYIFYKDSLIKQSIRVLNIKASSEKQIDKEDREVFYKELKLVLEKKGYEVVYDITVLGKSLIYIN